MIYPFEKKTFTKQTAHARRHVPNCDFSFDVPVHMQQDLFAIPI